MSFCDILVALILKIRWSWSTAVCTDCQKFLLPFHSLPRNGKTFMAFGWSHCSVQQMLDISGYCWQPHSLGSCRKERGGSGAGGVVVTIWQKYTQLFGSETQKSLVTCWIWNMMSFWSLKELHTVPLSHYSKNQSYGRFDSARPNSILEDRSCPSSQNSSWFQESNISQNINQTIYCL